LEAYDADIIILCLNRLEETTAAIASALGQRGGSFHVTVLDQGSDPETRRTLASRFAHARDFALYAAEGNLGVAGGRNLATSLGHGGVIVALDNDAVFKEPFVVAAALRRFSREPDLGALGFAILAAGGEKPDLTSWGYPRPLLSRFTSKFNTTTFVGAGHAIRRVTWDSVGGYDPALFFTWEEYDFCLSAIARGWRIGYDGALQIIHNRAPDARIDWSADRMTYYVRNRLLIARKWGTSWPALAPRIACHLIKARHNNCLTAAAAGVMAAWRTPSPVTQRMSKAMRSYIWANETRHRGGLAARIRSELFAKLPR
jgi:GT2 family glycosyltransferase